MTMDVVANIPAPESVGPYKWLRTPSGVSEENVFLWAGRDFSMALWKQ